MRESAGMFCVANSLWSRVRDIALRQFKRNAEVREGGSIQEFWQDSWEPELSCPLEERVGKRGDGGKWICQPHLLQHKCQSNALSGTNAPLVYSLGSHNDFSFEQSMLELCPCCEIHTFDMTSKAPTGQYEGLNVNFHNIGLGPEDSGDLRTFETIQAMLNHTTREIDIFKMDIEGNEYHFFDKVIAATPGTGALSRIRHMLIEFHVEYTREEKAKLNAVLLGLHEHGFIVTHKEPNLFSQKCMELALVRLQPGWFPKGDAATSTD